MCEEDLAIGVLRALRARRERRDDAGALRLAALAFGVDGLLPARAHAREKSRHDVAGEPEHRPPLRNPLPGASVHSATLRAHANARVRGRSSDHAGCVPSRRLRYPVRGRIESRRRRRRSVPIRPAVGPDKEGGTGSPGDVRRVRIPLELDNVRASGVRRTSAGNSVARVSSRRRPFRSMEVRE